MVFNGKKVLPPPWLAFPEIQRYSIGWRMGYGESYIFAFGEWYDALSSEEREEYQGLFPEPQTWKGYWHDEDDCQYYEADDFFIPLWNIKGTPTYSLTTLQQEYAQNKANDYLLFWGHRPSANAIITKSCLSQWWKAEFRYPAERYCCMEQFMMTKKAER